MAQVAAYASSASVAASGYGVFIADVAAGRTVGIAHTIGTSGGTILCAVVHGYLFP